MDDEQHTLPQDEEDEGTSEKSVVPMELRSISDVISREDWRNCPSPESPRKPVKSTAVVKYSTVRSLANFAALQCNTDLNSPPSNWLSSSVDSYGLQHVPSHSTGFSSFRMAHMFPECVGEVDVVSDAENIKKLLKIPYSKGPVSMVVHRIENTLLIDEFDIHKYLLQTAESEWKWLKKFFFEHVLQSLSGKEKGSFHKNKSRYALQQKSLISKFLYHSLAVAQAQSETPVQPQNTQCPSVPLPISVAEPPLPEPNLEEELPDPASNHEFARNVVWTFEDIQMLIGTNLPIFGGKTHPCISLKLRDMSKPINVLTGIDYWLDNLMCNVPELVMCYHLDGIVQKYELIKTEDLPHLENSKFSPKVIRDVAQNILSFLKSNATKAGHTYWLFKGKDAEIVKLYDLTSLCSDMMGDKEQNPFTIPVAMLLYRVARNMKHSPDGQRQQGTIRMLLKNCIQLLTKEKYPQIVTSAHYMLADLYIPADTDPAAPNLSDHLVEEGDIGGASEYEEEDGDPSESYLDPLSPSSSVDVKSLCVSTSSPAADNTPPPPLCGGVAERCSSALQHIAAGLQCLTLFGHNQDDSQRSENFEENSESREDLNEPAMARSFEAIPMPYAPLNKDKQQKDKGKAQAVAAEGSAKKRRKEQRNKNPEVMSPKSLLCQYRAEAMPTWQQPKPSDTAFWRSHLKILLYEKACLVYATLAETEYNEERYGSALRYISIVLHCQQQLERLANGAPNAGLQSYLLGRAGDLCFMIVQNWKCVDVHRMQFNTPSSLDKDVQFEMEDDAFANPISYLYMDLIPQNISTMEQMLLSSRACYLQALHLEPLEEQRCNLQRRLGNVENELGVLYMNQSAVPFQENGVHSQSQKVDMESLLQKSLRHLESGIQAFEMVHDEANLALLHSNTGRLMRMCAHCQSSKSPNQSELAGQERQFYYKALSSYQKALQVLGTRKTNPDIWDTVTWELSTTLYNMAAILQDFPSLGQRSEEEVEREVVELLLRTLKYCDLDTPGPRQLVYQFRAASIHHRLGSLYHRSYRTVSSDDSRRKNILQLSKLHYEKAYRLFLMLEQPCDFLRCQMERVALAEYQSQNASSPSVRIKALQSALEVMVQCEAILRVAYERLSCVQSKSPEKEKKSGEKKKICDSTLNQSINELSISGESKTSENNVKQMETSSETMKDDDGQHENIEIEASETVEEDGVENEEINAILLLLEQRLQYVLLQLTKLHHTRSSNKKETESAAAMYKNLYSITLRNNESNNSRELAQHLASILSHIECALRQNVAGSKQR